MNDRLNEITTTIEEERTMLYAMIDDLSQEELDNTPAQDQWSPGENLHHLLVCEILITGILAKQIEKAREKGMGPDPDKDSVLQSLDHHEIEKAKSKYNKQNPFMAQLLDKRLLSSPESSKEIIFIYPAQTETRQQHN